MHQYGAKIGLTLTCYTNMGFKLGMLHQKGAQKLVMCVAWYVIKGANLKLMDTGG